MEDFMNTIIRLAAVVVGLVLMSMTPSLGQIPNPTASDGNENTAGGTGALANVNETVVGGFSNTAFGFSALNQDTTGDSNTAMGRRALLNNTTGSNNNAIGVNVLASNTTGANNTASGVLALFQNTSGNENTATGANALFDNSTGIRNTAVGRSALRHSTGNKNIAIGFQAGGATLVIGNNNIYLGNPGNGNESQTIRIGTAQAQTFMAGIDGVGVSGSAVVVDGNGQLGVTLSSARYKRDIETMASRSEGLLKLRPVTFAYKDDTSAAPHYGLIAEEVATVYPELVTRTASGEVQTVKYHELILMLLNELQREHQEVATLKQELGELATLRKELAELRSLVGRGSKGAPVAR
jgi:hypothetical protein